MEYYTAERKKELPPFTTAWMDQYYAKWNKPGGEGKVPYDLTFNRNLINKRKKQTKYNQRHWS